MASADISTDHLAPTLPARYSAEGGPHCTTTGPFERCIFHATDVASGQRVVVKSYHSNAPEMREWPMRQWARGVWPIMQNECAKLRHLEQRRADRASGHGDEVFDAGRIRIRVPRCVHVCADATCAEADTMPFVAVTRVGGMTLKAFATTLKSRGRHEQRVALLTAVRAALQTLQWIWSNGVVHRDVSGANLVVDSSERGELSVALIDFDGAVLVGECSDEAAPVVAAGGGQQHTGGHGSAGGSSKDCVPSHALPSPPWDSAISAPSSYSLPPELWAAAMEGRARVWHRRHESFAFDAWGLGVAVLRTLSCSPTLPERVWRWQLAQQRTRTLNDAIAADDGLASPAWLHGLDPACFAYEHTPPELLAILATLLSANPVARGPPQRLLTAMQLE